MPPYEALYGRECRSPIHWDKVGKRKPRGLEILHQAENVIPNIRARIKIA